MSRLQGVMLCASTTLLTKLCSKVVGSLATIQNTRPIRGHPSVLEQMGLSKDLAAYPTKVIARHKACSIDNNQIKRPCRLALGVVHLLNSRISRILPFTRAKLALLTKTKNPSAQQRLILVISKKTKNFKFRCLMAQMIDSYRNNYKFDLT